MEIGYGVLFLAGLGLVYLTYQLAAGYIIVAMMSMGGHGATLARRRLIAIPLALIAAGTGAAWYFGLDPLISAALLAGPLGLCLATLTALRSYYRRKYEKEKQKQEQEKSKSS